MPHNSEDEKSDDSEESTEESSDETEEDENQESSEDDQDDDDNEEEDDEDNESSSDDDFALPPGPINLIMGGLPIRPQKRWQETLFFASSLDHNVISTKFYYYSRFHEVYLMWRLYQNRQEVPWHNFYCCHLPLLKLVIV